MTPEIVARVAAWVDAQPSVSDRIDALHLGFTKAGDAAERHRWAGDDAGARAHWDGARGFLLAMVREAWGRPGATTYLRDDGWRVSLGQLEPFQRDGFTSEAEALVAALENAPADGGGR